MKTFDIIGPDEAIRPALVEKINNLTKPKGSLGMLESLALQVGLIQQSLTLFPKICIPNCPCLIQQIIVKIKCHTQSKTNSCAHTRRVTLDGHIKVFTNFSKGFNKVNNLINVFFTA